MNLESIEETVAKFKKKRSYIKRATKLKGKQNYSKQKHITVNRKVQEYIRGIENRPTYSTIR